MKKKLYESTNGIFGDGPAMLKGIQDTAREANIKRNAGLNSSTEDDLLARQLAAYQQSGTDHVGYVNYGDYQIVPMDGKFQIMGQDSDSSFSDANEAIEYLIKLSGQQNSQSPKELALNPNDFNFTSEKEKRAEAINKFINPKNKNPLDYWLLDPINGLINSPLTMTREAEDAIQQAAKEGKGFGAQMWEALKAYPRGFLKSIDGDYVELGEYIMGFPLLEDLTEKWEKSGPIGNATHDTIEELVNFFGPALLGKLVKAGKISDLSSKSEIYEAYKEIFDFINDAKDIKDTATDAVTDIKDQLNPQN